MSDCATQDFSSKRVRQLFLEFFRQRAHHLVAPIPIVVKEDPSLMFINAGMNAFKDIFLDLQSPTYPRIANSQPCLRVSGKHNDLEEVGVDSYHHTLFEMLGNWSFGDYFKEQAIQWAWELLTEVYGLDKERLYVTVFAGNPQDCLQRDQDSAKIWQSFLPSERILYFDAKDNFWEMGDIGPCGPCTEIHFDCRSLAERTKVPGHLLVNQDNPEVIEIWNLVFMEFMRNRDGTLIPLKQKHVDTGMGLERLLRILQGKKSNYDTDLFSPIIMRIAELTSLNYTYANTQQDIAFRVLADHIRAIAFCISEGAMPANTGAGYVIKRIMHRAIRYYYTHLNQDKPLLYQLIPVLGTQFQEVFPAIQSQSESLSNLIYAEEEQFLRTIGQGIKRLHQYIDLSPSTNILPGNLAFELYDTYGFPLDVTQMVLADENWTVDEDGFYASMQEQKDRSRRVASAENMGEWLEVNDGTSEFVGYTQEQIKTQILRYRQVIHGNSSYFQLVLSKSPFYAQSGGQAGDIGWLEATDGRQIEIIDTQKELGQIVHLTHSIPKDLQGDFVAKIDSARRKILSLHHSATHLLQAALQKYLGLDTQQRGSSITPERLRFDFNYNGKISADTLAKITTQVNTWIKQKLAVKVFQSTLAEAKKMGAMAIFGEKYANEVRVVQIGEISLELCGGTHIQNTIELQEFRILQESAVASGIRRIEAIAGSALENFLEAETHKQREELAQWEQKITQLTIEGQKVLNELEVINSPNSTAKFQELSKSWNRLIADSKELSQVTAQKQAYKQIKKQIELYEKILAQSYAQKLLIYLKQDTNKKQEMTIDLSRFFDLNYCQLKSNLLQVYMPNYAYNMHNLCQNMLNYLRINGVDVIVFLLIESDAQKSALLLDLGDNKISSGQSSVEFLRKEIVPLMAGGAGGGAKQATAGGKKIAFADLPQIFAKLSQLTEN